MVQERIPVTREFLAGVERDIVKQYETYLRQLVFGGHLTEQVLRDTRPKITRRYPDPPATQEA